MTKVVGQDLQVLVPVVELLRDVGDQAQISLHIPSITVQLVN